MKTGGVRKLVSFIVPTLNRGRYVIRAVASCLECGAPDADVAVEIVVLDSQSDDGSWEEMQKRFGADPRVILAQNRRGLGPTHSWLDGAKLVHGDYATFLWSDDYVSPGFLSRLVPALEEGAMLAVGNWSERNIEDEGPLPSSAESVRVTPEAFGSHYVRRTPITDVPRPVSPACSLFTKEVFDAWRDMAESWCTATPLRREIMWRRAIGPDLLLYLVAIRRSSSGIVISRDAVAQFSSHPSSITTSSSSTAYDVGYWLARLWYVVDASRTADLPAGRFAVDAAALFVDGAVLAGKLWLGASRPEDKFCARDMVEELQELFRAVTRRNAWLRFVLLVPYGLCRVPMRRIRRLVSGFRPGSAGPRTAAPGG